MVQGQSAKANMSSLSAVFDWESFPQLTYVIVNARAQGTVSDGVRGILSDPSRTNLSELHTSGTGCMSFCLFGLRTYDHIPKIEMELTDILRHTCTFQICTCAKPHQNSCSSAS